MSVRWSLRRCAKIIASGSGPASFVIVRLDRTIGRDTVPVRMVRSSRTMTMTPKRGDSIVFGRRLTTFRTYIWARWPRVDRAIGRGTVPLERSGAAVLNDFGVVHGGTSP